MDYKSYGDIYSYLEQVTQIERDNHPWFTSRQCINLDDMIINKLSPYNYDAHTSIPRRSVKECWHWKRRQNLADVTCDALWWVETRDTPSGGNETTVNMQLGRVLCSLPERSGKPKTRILFYSASTSNSTALVCQVRRSLESAQFSVSESKGTIPILTRRRVPRHVASQHLT